MWWARLHGSTRIIESHKPSRDPEFCKRVRAGINPSPRSLFGPIRSQFRASRLPNIGDLVCKSVDDVDRRLHFDRISIYQERLVGPLPHRILRRLLQFIRTGDNGEVFYGSILADDRVQDHLPLDSRLLRVHGIDRRNFGEHVAALGESPAVATIPWMFAARATADAQVPAPSKTQATAIASRPKPRISFFFSVSRISLLSRVLASKIPMA